MDMVKVFLSHSSKDKDLARKIAIDLRSNDINVWFDEWEICVGESITQKISQGLEDSDFVAVLITNNSINSGWVEKEWQSKIGQEASEKKVAILPLKAESCKIPQILKDKLYADISSNYQEGFNRLLVSLASLKKNDLPKQKRNIQLKNINSNNELHFVENIFSHIINSTMTGNYIKMAYKCHVNPVTYRLMPTCRFFDELIFYATQYEDIILLEYDADELIYPASAYLSYHLLELALTLASFKKYHQKIGLAIEAHNSKEYNDWKKQNDPWYRKEVGGAKLFTKIVKELKLNVIVILKNILWVVDDESEYLYSEEIPMLGSAMSVIFDIWDKIDLSELGKYKKLFDNIIDDTAGYRRYNMIK